MFRLECSIPKNHKVTDYDSFLAMGSSCMVVYIKIPNLTDSNGNKAYMVFPDGESGLTFWVDYIGDYTTFDDFIGCWEQFDNCYNVEVVDFAPTVKICAKIGRDNYVKSST